MLVLPTGLFVYHFNKSSFLENCLLYCMWYKFTHWWSVPWGCWLSLGEISHKEDAATKNLLAVVASRLSCSLHAKHSLTTRWTIVKPEKLWCMVAANKFQEVTNGLLSRFHNCSESSQYVFLGKLATFVHTNICQWSKQSQGGLPTSWEILPWQLVIAWGSLTSPLVYINGHLATGFPGTTIKLQQRHSPNWLRNANFTLSKNDGQLNVIWLTFMCLQNLIHQLRSDSCVSQKGPGLESCIT